MKNATRKPLSLVGQTYISPGGLYQGQIVTVIRRIGTTQRYIVEAPNGTRWTSEADFIRAHMQVQGA